MARELQSITIPSSVIELKNGWCDGTSDLKRVEVETGNLRYLSVDCKYIIEKSEDYDTLIIWKRDVVEVDTPNSNKVIGPYSFNFSNLERITIPASVTRIYKNAFDCFNYLVRVEFDPNSQLQKYRRKSFLLYKYL